jgi:predicted transcriptional regulator
MQDKQKVTLYLPPELHRRLKVRAAIDADTMTDIAQKAIAFYLSHPEVVEQQTSYGQTHRIYACPDCASPIALRDGEIVSLGSQPSPLVEESLSVEKVQKVGIVEGTDSQGEGELVPC